MLNKVHIISNEKVLMKNKVKVLTGGRQLYEPVFLKYLAPEILTAAIVGSKYSAPSSDDICSILKYLSEDHRCGIIVIIPNSLEESINFKLGIAKANHENISVELISVSDNCWKMSEERRPSLAGLCFVYKLAGIMKESSMEINEIYEMLIKIRMKTISCQMKKSFSFLYSNLESGTGKFINTSNLSDLISVMLDSIFIEKDSYFQVKDTSFIVLLNCYRSDKIFLNICGIEILKQIESRPIDIMNIYLGNFIFGPKGFSITIIEATNDRLLQLANATYSNHIWPRTEDSPRTSFLTLSKSVGPFAINTDFIKIPLRFTCEAMMSSKGVFNKLDVNNNFGTAIFPVLDIILTQSTKREICHDRPYNLFTKISWIFQEVMKDMYGNLFHILFSGIARALSYYSQDVPIKGMMWLESLDYGINFVKESAGVAEGDLTFIDVLSPFVSILEHHLSYSDRDLNEKLGEALHETNKILETSYSTESHRKRKGYPEVSTQASFVALTSIFQGVRVVMNSTRSQNS